MLSCRLDPVQDLQSGSKLLTLYDVCCIIRGGGRLGGLRPSCKIHGGIMSMYTKMSRGGGGCPGGFCPTLLDPHCCLQVF